MPFRLVIALQELREHGAELSAPDVAVFTMLALRADKDGVCWPSYARLAKDARVSRNTAIASVERLTAARLLAKEARLDSSGDATSNAYRVLLGVVQELHHPVQQAHHPVQEMDPGSPSAGPGVVQQMDPGGAGDGPEVFHLSLPQEANQGTRGRGRSAPTRATRMTEGWKPDPEVAEWCRSQGVDLERVLPNFVDHWTSSAGKNASKLDWNATLRVWIRRDLESGRAPLLMQRQMPEPTHPSFGRLTFTPPPELAKPEMSRDEIEFERECREFDDAAATPEGRAAMAAAADKLRDALDEMSLPKSAPTPEETARANYEVAEQAIAAACKKAVVNG